MKNVAIAAATPAGNLDEANAILGKVVEPKTRWNVGSLVGSATSGILQAVVIFMSGSKLQIFAPLEAAATAAFGGLAGGVEGLIRFVPLGASGRSRSVLAEYYDGSGLWTLAGSPTGSLYEAPVVFAGTSKAEVVGALVGASVPSWTLSGLISKIDSILSDREIPIPYAVAVNQFTGVVYLAIGNDLIAASDIALVSTAGSLYAEFDLSDPVSGGGDPEVPGPVWG